MPIRPEVIPFLLAAVGLAALLLILLRVRRAAWRVSLISSIGLAVVLGSYFLYFFRDPERHAPSDPAAIVAGADGTIMSVGVMPETTQLHTNAVRISIFLSLFDVHVNRSPVSGRIEFAAYYPGTRYFTFQEKSSLYNQHSAILIAGGPVPCLVHQIVGPVARRVVYWLRQGQEIQKGDRIGMMKFGSRLDMYLPADAVDVVARPGDKVHAGETVVARLKDKGGP